MVSVTLEARRKSHRKMQAGGFFEAVIPQLTNKEPLDKSDCSQTAVCGQFMSIGISQHHSTHLKEEREVSVLLESLCSHAHCAGERRFFLPRTVFMCRRFFGFELGVHRAPVIKCGDDTEIISVVPL